MKKTLNLVAAFLSAVFLCVPCLAADITPAGMTQGDLVKFLYEVQENARNRLLTSVGIATATTTNCVKITTAGVALYNGEVKVIAAADNQKRTATAQATGTTRWYLFTYNCESATTEVTAGTAGTLTLAQFHPIASTNVPIALMQVVNASGANFTLGTTGLDEHSVTVTYYQLPGITRFKFDKTVSY